MEKKHIEIGGDPSKDYQIGVIIGRFQIHELHEAHTNLIDAVIKKHHKVIIFLGVNSIGPTKRNPLDFDSRKRMLQTKYPQIVIAPLKDVNNDDIWSAKLDEKIKEIYPMGKALLYGGRDSFIPHYKGKNDTAELHQEIFLSGTEVRKILSQKIQDSSDYRAGKINAAYNRYPVSFTTVDIIPVNYDRQEILLAKKPNESKYRFIGGFADPKDESFESAAKRELTEEAGTIETGPMEYIASMLVDDWRYRSEEDKIKTMLFKCQYAFGSPRPNDDIEEVRWFKIEDFFLLNGAEINNKFIEENIMDVHVPLMKKFCENFQKDPNPKKQSKKVTS
jgi:bifunctional NMN adenylyltransferase/nudix hydrolase